MSPTSDRDELLALNEQDLARQSTFGPYKSGGPGGQKRNKTSSAVKWTHELTGVSAHSSDFREQSVNRVRALHRLRVKLATELRQPIDPRGYEPPSWLIESRVAGKLTTNTKNPIYARLAAIVLDVFRAVGGRASETSALLGIPTSNLIHFLEADEVVWSAAARLRTENKLPTLSKR